MTSTPYPAVAPRSKEGWSAKVDAASRRPACFWSSYTASWTPSFCPRASEANSSGSIASSGAGGGVVGHEDVVGDVGCGVDDGLEAKEGVEAVEGFEAREGVELAADRDCRRLIASRTSTKRNISAESFLRAFLTCAGMPSALLSEKRRLMPA